MGLQINMPVTELKFRRPIFPPLNTYLSNVLVLGPHVAVFESRNLLIKARLKIDKNAVSRGFLSLIARAARPSAAGGGKYVQRWECRCPHTWSRASPFSSPSTVYTASGTFAPSSQRGIPSARSSRFITGKLRGCQGAQKAASARRL